MKTLKMLLLLGAMLCLTTACPDPWYADPDAEGFTNAPEVVTIPFKAEFVANFKTVNSNPLTCCGTGSGTGTCFESLTCNLTRCGDPSTGECQFTPDSYLHDGNGNKLFFSAAASMQSPSGNDPAFYSRKWDTMYTIRGGTGRFAGVTGSGTWHGYVTNKPGEENSAHSILSGTITIEKSKILE